MSLDINALRLAEFGDRLTTLQQQQAVFLSILETLVGAVAAQTEMLGEILAASQQEPGPSETTEALAQLAIAVQENTAAVHEMNGQPQPHRLCRPDLLRAQVGLHRLGLCAHGGGTGHHPSGAS
jgi:hypothetical protein